MTFGKGMNQKGAWGIRSIGNYHWECPEPKRLLREQIE